MPRTPTPPIERILRRLEPARTDDECWLWPGALQGAGYGLVFIAVGKTALVHREVYSALVGPIPEGLLLDHTCHNADPDCPGGSACIHRRCCNPAHLEPKVHRDNQEAADEPRGRGRFKKECAKGHPYDDENTGWMVRGKRGGQVRNGRERYCKQCNRDKAAARSRR